jgi:spermidine/putrescine transport system ATP-binding protein
MMGLQGVLSLNGVSKLFGGDSNGAGVRDLNIEIQPGEGFSLLGPSGCGKSTTLRLIGGFEKPDQGRIRHGNVDITNLPPQKREIRTVFQRYALFPHLDVRANISFGLRMQKKSPAEINKKVDWAIQLLQISHLEKRAVSALSGGEQQRVALARALVTEPSVLLLDEPLSALDLKLRERMQLELLALRRKLGSSFLFVTHDQGEAMTLSDRIAVMNSGSIVQVGTPYDIYHRPSSRFVAEFIGQANFLPPAKVANLTGDLERLPKIAAGQDWMVRPEHFTPRAIGWQPPKGFVAVQARVNETAFLGPEWMIKCSDKEGFTYLLKTPGFEPLPAKVGEEFVLSWETEDTWTVGSF